ncbi:reverse transcriptase-like protein [Halalkalibacter urbisdiaboli]|uniref:reverse transcriptase-like protein n=1 Tax=Halalkalibacter urbisdiaboli TaxID=1960589 RepID=UPI000B4323E5|nr:reverse transcriptase-like protein [Halalkalibacter urbisdiaboli]
MNVRIEWTYREPKRKREYFMKSEQIPLGEALQLAEDLEKTGRLKELTFYDEQDTSWTKKDLLRYLKKFETEPHDIYAYFDGGFDIQSKQAGLGIVIYYTQHHKKWRIRHNQKIDLLLDNNEAEYAALSLLYDKLEELGVHHQPIVIHADSMVVVNQASGEWPCFEENYIPWLERIEQKVKKLGLTPSYELLERQLNKEADQLASQALKNVEISSVLEQVQG